MNNQRLKLQRKHVQHLVVQARADMPENQERSCKERCLLTSPNIFLRFFSQRKLSKEAWEEVLNCEKKFFHYVGGDLDAYARHACRRTIQVEDVELLMKRQGAINDKVSFNSLVEKHLPMEMRQVPIPCARSCKALK